nr:nucleotidyltransferase family protein [Oleisolibacter albus]
MSAVPARAMVLAAGLGLRMRPLTLTTPKPLIAVGGRTMLDHALDRLAAAGVRQAVVNAHWLADRIETHLAARTAEPPTLLSREEAALETGGGVKKALPLLGDDPFFVVNADIVWLDGPVPALKRLAQAWDPARMDALLLMVPLARAIGYDGRGDYHMDPAGRLTFRSAQDLAPFVFGGVCIMSPALYRDTPDGPFSNLVLWHRAEAAGRLYGLRHDGPWYHVGTPEAVPLVDAAMRNPRGPDVEP